MCRNLPHLLEYGPDTPLPDWVAYHNLSPGIVNGFLVNGPVQWGGSMWAAVTWDTIANWPARTRGEVFLHELSNGFQFLRLWGSRESLLPSACRFDPNCESLQLESHRSETQPGSLRQVRAR